jgi:hypothetical protein
VGSTHIPWRDITNTRTYDAGLIASISSLDLDSADVYLSVHEEMDGLGDVHGTPEEFRAFYAKIAALAAIYAPRAQVGQVLASADRLSTWVVRDADFFGFDPHFYDWPTASFQAQVDNVVARMAEAGVGGRPFIINTGGVEDSDDPDAKADGSGDVRSGGRTRVRVPVRNMVGYREREGCGRTVDSPRSLAAWASTTPLTHPASPTGSAEWSEASRAPRGASFTFRFHLADFARATRPRIPSSSLLECSRGRRPPTNWCHRWWLASARDPTPTVADCPQCRGSARSSSNVRGVG